MTDDNNHTSATEAPQPSAPQRTFYLPVVRPYVTYAIILVLVVIHLYLTALSEREMLRVYFDYGNYAAFITQGELYRLFTSMFLHAGLIHLAFNCIALHAFGTDIEGIFGHVRFALIYFLGGLAGSVASYIVTQGNSIGASGAVFAVFGATVAYYYRNRGLYGETATQRLRQLGMLALVNLIIGLASNVPGSMARIDNAAHIGGALGGLVLAWFMTPLFVRRTGFVEGQVVPVLVDHRKAWHWLYIPVVFAGALFAVLSAVLQARA